ncbi:hypothetical protein EHI8A_155580 [Entamoeba histolytica HM-1:IMSS-B]|uniref:Phosphatidate cytidylyltransferase n=6 Tax=Entamoeba histolytica TaxID=5759 RepID=C4MAC0_ENTH1|nr:hypothetical protein, conserved [Entamoeba histolytica HM-1:IMSS]EMD48626.1 Hypothetical protein EHI5A_125840 [Entamoeba histolytica KU27]EMH76415.1 hypothetical protein EHI8A_155580 [Entamoeba histolytica HM-1:IMSS-B]EMS13099.1 hypothetical protein KM1_232120 [Entamoeba histolytica HM-3:IMSS]ENY64577.1 hypothetical protein EHI7A_132270 [Entamoeba histolytica HM-1:IMSS-A]GAT98724.1 hypothetical protein conserved [Entamoeba histolytica]|eukprot:XP_648836.1 hypothetical protein, conserved [Entamoeba histolytica HM-1:IMSS]
MNYLFAYLLSFCVLVITLLLIVILKRCFSLQSCISRKLTHLLTGPFFILTWKFYPNTSLSCYIAATLPLSISLLLLFCYLFQKLSLSQFIIQIISRNKEPHELLEGPFIYGVVISLITMLFWYDTPVGIISIIILCLGDGMADIIGSLSTRVIPAPFGRKTFDGCCSFIFFSFIGCLVFEYIIFRQIWILNTLAIVSLGCFTEFISPSLFDNLTITLTTSITAFFIHW